jgi:ATP-binding cassette subfamily C protein LapB
LSARFGIGRGELKRLGLPETRLLGLPLSVVGASVAINILGLAMPLGILQVYDRIIPHASVETLTAMVGILVAAAFLEAILRVARGYIAAWGAARFVQVSLVDAFGRILLGARRGLPAKDVQVLQAVQRLGDYFGGRSRLLLLDMPFVAIFLVMIGLIGGLVVLVAIAVLCVFAVVTILLGRRLKRLFEARDGQDTKIYDFITDSLTGIGNLKGLAMEPQMLRRFERLQASAAAIDYRSIEAALVAESTVTTLGNITMVAMVTFGAVLAVNGHLTIGALSACSLLSGRIVQPILGAASLWNEVQKMRLGLGAIEDVFTAKRPAPGPAIELPRDGAPPTLRLAGAASRLGDRPVLDGADWDLPAGAVGMVVGPDEAAKSALLRLVSGETEPDRGEALVDGMPAAEFRRIRMGAAVLVPAQPAFFRGSILDNLTLFERGPSADQAQRAVHLVGLAQEIDRLPLGYDTRLGEGIAETLPIGFLKRLSIARALALGPRLLVLDQPQAFLDTEADRQLIACLGRLKGHVTIVLSSNRPSYRVVATDVVECRNGRLLAEPRP